MSDDIKPIERSGISIRSLLQMKLASFGGDAGFYHEPVRHWEVERKDTRGTVTERLLAESHYSSGGGPMPDRLSDAIAWLQRYLAAVPEDCRDTAMFEIESVGGYEGEHHAEMTISYARPETDEEWAARKADVEARLAVDTARREAEERAEFERLQAKFAAKGKP